MLRVYLFLAVLCVLFLAPAHGKEREAETYAVEAGRLAPITQAHSFRLWQLLDGGTGRMDRAELPANMIVHCTVGTTGRTLGYLCLPQCDRPESPLCHSRFVRAYLKARSVDLGEIGFGASRGQREVLVSIPLDPGSQRQVDFDSDAMTTRLNVLGPEAGLIMARAFDYPPRAQRAGVQGRVFVRCRVMEDRSLACAQRSVEPADTAGYFRHVGDGAGLGFAPLETLPDGSSPVGRVFEYALRFQLR